MFLTEASLSGDWPDKIMSQIEAMLKGRLEGFYKRQSDGGHNK
jgi:hypothetical protein